MNFILTNSQKLELIHVIGKSAWCCFRKLWLDLEGDIEYNKNDCPDWLHKEIGNTMSITKGVLLDASFNKLTMKLTIGNTELDLLNNLLKMGNYGTIDNPNSRGLNFPIK